MIQSHNSVYHVLQRERGFELSSDSLVCEPESILFEISTVVPSWDSVVLFVSEATVVASSVKVTLSDVSVELSAVVFAIVVVLSVADSVVAATVVSS